MNKSQDDNSSGLRPYLNFLGFERLSIIRQSAAAECGLCCIAMIASYYGYNCDLTELRRRFSFSLRGSDLKVLTDIAGEINLSSRVLQCELTDLKNIRTPCILHWEFDHFVVLKSAKKRRIVIYDPARGIRHLTHEELSKGFTGIVAELVPTSKFKNKKASPKLKVSELIRLDRSFFSTFTQGVVLTGVAELLVLASPFYMQFIIDGVLLKGDVALLYTLGLGFALIGLLQIVATALRGMVFQYLAHVLSFDMSARIFHKLLRLPIYYFNTRHLGDIQQRVTSLEQIKNFLVSGAPIAILDGVFSIMILIIMFNYSAMLAGVVLGVLAIYGIWQIGIFYWMKKAAGDLIVAETLEQTHLLESIRAILSLKVAALETRREQSWQSRYANKQNASIRVGNIQIINGTFQGFITRGLAVGIVFMAALMVIDNQMTIGMLTAVVAYCAMFQSRIVALIQTALAYKLLQVPLGRIADIAFHETEQRGVDGGRGGTVGGRIELRNVYFSYGTNEQLVLQGANLVVERGWSVVITGPSGCGKSTLLKVVLGLDKCQIGEVLYDDRNINKWSPGTLRNQIGVVMQESSLLQGTLAENISFFDPQINMQRIQEVASLACISDDIEAFPMGYETRVGDMASTLSGGQKQRLEIARALYRKPKILFLDEATSHLDAATEEKIYANLFELNLTLVAIAHRLETLNKADKLIVMKDGQLTIQMNDQKQDTLFSDAAYEQSENI